jgi:hypothetical protein
MRTASRPKSVSIAALLFLPTFHHHHRCIILAIKSHFCNIASHLPESSMVYPTKQLGASHAMLAFALTSFLMMNIRFAKNIKLGGRSVLTTSTSDFLLTSDTNHVAGYSAGQALRYRQQAAKSRVPTSSASVCKQRKLDKDWFKSQSKEDERLLTWFKNLCGGHYLEMGGLDGVRKSNSYVFNKGLDWKGVLVEAS